MDVINLWKTTGDSRKDKINIIKSWLCDSTEGQTYSITDNVLDFDASKIMEDGYDYWFPEEAFDAIVGFKHDYCVDDPTLDDIATKMYDALMDFNNDVSEHPEKYFDKRKPKGGFKCVPHEGISCDYCCGTDNECIYEKDCPFKVKNG